MDASNVIWDARALRYRLQTPQAKPPFKDDMERLIRLHSLIKAHVYRLRHRMATCRCYLTKDQTAEALSNVLDFLSVIDYRVGQAAQGWKAGLDPSGALVYVDSFRVMLQAQASGSDHSATVRFDAMSALMRVEPFRAGILKEIHGMTQQRTRGVQRKVSESKPSTYGRNRFLSSLFLRPFVASFRVFRPSGKSRPVSRA